MSRNLRDRVITGVFVLPFLAVASATLFVAGCPGLSFFGGIKVTGAICERDATTNCVTNLPCNFDGEVTVHLVGEDPCLIPDPPPTHPQTCVELINTVPVFPSAERSILIRDDKDAGHARLTVTAGKAATSFTWCVPTKAASDLLQFDPALTKDINGNYCVTKPVPNIADGLSGYVDIKVIGDPGGGVGERVTVTVSAAVAGVDGVGNPVSCDVAGNAPVVLEVRRPDAPLVAVLTPVEGGTVAPGKELTLRATISGGTPFADNNRVCSVSASVLSPLNNNGREYCVVWSVSEVWSVSGTAVPLAGAGVFTPHDLRIENGEFIAEAIYKAPATRAGNVVFTVSAQDSKGNQAPATASVIVASAESLAFGLAFGETVLFPGDSTPLTATVQGGTKPYTVCFGVTAGQGTLSQGDSNCNPITIQGVTHPTCVCHAPLKLVSFTAPSAKGTATVTAKVRDGVNSVATAVASVNVNEQGSGGNGGGVALALAVDHPAVCAGSTEEVIITATATGGTNNAFTFVPVSVLSQDPASTSSVLKLRYKASVTFNTQSITVTVTSVGGSSASQTVNIESRDGTCNDLNDCTADSCSFGACIHDGAPNNGHSCNDGNACTQTDTCNSGSCLGSNPVVCTALDQCHDVGICDPGTGQCPNPAKLNGTACNDSNACTQSDSCLGGVCTGSNPVVCTALDQCHDAGTCNTGTGQCSNPAKTNGTGCNDSNACTQSDSCQGGVCTGSNPVVCTALDQCHDVGICNPGTGLCSNPAKLDGSACNDGVFCNGADTCSGGACTVHTGDPCLPLITTDNNCAGSCNEAARNCSSPDPNNTACNDGDACTTGDACQNGVCLGTPQNCNDGNLCTTDLCVNGSCVNINSVVCTALDQCHDVGICNPGTGVCSNPSKLNGSLCNDSDACTQNDTCQGGSCVGSNPVICPAPDQCHNAGTCDPGTGVCSNPAKPNGTGCNDSNACTQTDTCQSGNCVGSNPVVCTALDQCHDVGTCNTGTGVCSNPPLTGTPCNDGNPCTHTDTCSGGICAGTLIVTCINGDGCCPVGCNAGNDNDCP